MKNKRIFGIGVLFACSSILIAQNKRDISMLQYTIDKQIPSYTEIIDKGFSTPRTTLLKTRHVGLERLLKLNNDKKLLNQP